MGGPRSRAQLWAPGERGHAGAGLWWRVARRLREGALVTAAWQKHLPPLPPSPPLWPLASQEALWVNCDLRLPLDVGREV